MIKEIRIPEISENVTSGKVVAVLVEPDDDVEKDDPLIEFETEKAVVEIPSPYKGRITEVLVGEGDELNVGDTFAKIDTEKAPEGETEQASEDDASEGGAAEKGPERESEKEATTEKAVDTTEKAAVSEEPEDEEKRKESTDENRREAAKKSAGDKDQPARRAAEKRPESDGDAEKGPAPASPSVRRFARELGVDIHAVKPSESGGRITEADIKTHVRRGLAGDDAAGVAETASASAESAGLPDFGRWGEVEVRELAGVRRLTAQSMAAAWRTVAHVTQFERVDITSAKDFIERNADKAAEQGGKLTLTAVLMKVCAAGLKRFGQFNASIDPEKNRLIMKKYIHIGVAVDTPRGLLVPVVRDADRKTILELAVEIVDLARRARNKKIKPDEMEGGTFTISNQGGIGGTDFTPLVFWPQAAILGVSRASVEPRYVDGEFRPREILPLALTYDHRIADGADAARFVRWIRESIEQPLTLHLD